jgi:hypothetical protein
MEETTDIGAIVSREQFEKEIENIAISKRKNTRGFFMNIMIRLI